VNILQHVRFRQKVSQELQHFLEAKFVVFLFPKWLRVKWFGHALQIRF